MIKSINKKSKRAIKLAAGSVFAISLGVLVGSYSPKPSPLSINEMVSLVASSPTTPLFSTILDSDKVIKDSGWKLLGYKGVIPYISEGLMVIPGPITPLTTLWTSKLDIPVSNLSSKGVIVEVSLVSMSEKNLTGTPFTMVASFSSDKVINGKAFAIASTEAIVSPKLATYRFLFTPNQFSEVDKINAISIGLNPLGADVKTMVIREISISRLD